MAKMFTSTRTPALLIAGAAMILLSLPACKEAPNAPPFEYFTTYTGTPLETQSPYVVSVFPDNNALEVPQNAQYVVLFNIPIDEPSFDTNVTIQSSSEGLLTPGALADYEISWNGASTIATIDFHYGPSSPLTPEGDVVQVTLPATIAAAAPLTGALTNAGTRQFTVGTYSDTTLPAVTAASRNPAPLSTDVELTVDGRYAASPSQEIHINFSEHINPATIDGSTFILNDGVADVPATYSFIGNPLYRAILTPTVDLAPDTTYTVTVTTGMEDLAGNPLAAGTSWTFETVVTDITGPTVDGGPTVDLVTDTDAMISWSTSEPTDYTFYYDRETPPVSSYTEVSYSTYHAVAFEPAPVSDTLTTNARYWFYFDLSDLAANPGTMPAPTPRQFNTGSGETPDPVHQAAGNQLTAKKLTWRPFNGNPSGFFLFWTDASTPSNALYGQRYDNALIEGWNAATPQPLFTEGGQNHTYQSSVDDGVDGVIVLALRSGNNRVYAKRKLQTNGNLEWIHTPVGQGFLVRDTVITGSMRAVPVHTGVTSNVVASRAAPNTTEMGSQGLSNYFFDDDQDLSGLTDGDIIMEDATNGGTTIDNNSGSGQDFRYILGQDANIIGPGETYYIGDASSSEAINAADHEVLDTPTVMFLDFVSGPLDAYTPHGYTLPGGWTLGSGDIITSGGTYTRLSGNPVLRSPITGANLVDSGTVDGPSNNHLLDSTRTWTTGPVVQDGDIVVNVTDSLITTVAALGVTDIDLTLDTPPNMNFDYLFPGPGDAYWIYDRYCNDHIGDTNQFQSFYELGLNDNIGIMDATAFTVYDYTGPTGTADPLPANPLYDNAGNFDAAGPAPLPVVAGDVVINTTDSTAAEVTAVSYQHALTLDSAIMADNENYFVGRYRFTPVVTGRADGGGAALIHDTTKIFTLTVAVGDAAYNPGTNQYAMVTAVAANDLTLSQAAGFGNGFYYAVFKRRVLYVWQEAAGILGHIVTLDAPLTSLRGTAAAPFTIAAGGTSPRAFSDSNGNAIVVYVDAAGEVRALGLDGYGNSMTGWNYEADTQVLAAESITDVQSDNAAGVVILYKHGGNMYAQRINSTGRLWGASGITLENAALTTSQEALWYIAPNDVVVAATTATNEIWVNRAGGTNWDVAGLFIGDEAVNTVTNLPASVQNYPQIFYDGADVIVLWQDNRFLNPPAAYFGGNADATGIFGVKRDGATGALDAAWYADPATATDSYGVSIIFNLYNNTDLFPLVASYDDGNGAVLIWEDFRYNYGAGENRDLVYTDLDGFTPP